MRESTIQALLTYDLTVIEGVKCIVIPYEDILREKVSVSLQEEQPESRAIEISKSEITISIPSEIKAMYKDAEKMAQDVTDYLKIISKCWQYHEFKFQSSILKKAAAEKPALNTAIFTVYGKDGDKHLTTLVEQNLPFIQQCWNETNTK